MGIGKCRLFQQLRIRPPSIRDRIRSGATLNAYRNQGHVMLQIVIKPDSDAQRCSIMHCTLQSTRILVALGSLLYMQCTGTTEPHSDPQRQGWPAGHAWPAVGMETPLGTCAAEVASTERAVGSHCFSLKACQHAVLQPIFYRECPIRWRGGSLERARPAAGSAQPRGRQGHFSS